MTQLGADVEALDRTAGVFADQSRRLTTVASLLSLHIRSAWWEGRDGHEFTSRWTGTHAPTLRRVADELAERGDALRRQAEQQRRASQGAGGGVGGGAGGVMTSFVPVARVVDASLAAVETTGPHDGWARARLTGNVIEPDRLFARLDAHLRGPTHPYGDPPTQDERDALEEIYAASLTDETIDGKPVVDVKDDDDFNALANFAEPDHVYRHGDYQWTTDDQGRVVRAEGQISLDPAGRNDPDLQTDIGNEGRQSDVGFHVIADRFGALTNRLNVVPGNGAPIDDGLPNLNNGAYKEFENTIAELAEDHDVLARISPSYDPGNTTNRPDLFIVEYRVDGGAWIEDEFVNK